MGDLEDVDVEIWLGPQERRLSGRLEIAGEQHPETAGVGHEDDAGIVSRGLAGLDEPARPHDVEVQGAGDLDPHAGPRDRGRDSGLAEQLIDPRGILLGIGQRRHQRSSDPASGKDSGQAGHVVGVKMGEDEQRHLTHAERVEAAPHGSRLRSGVDHHGGARTGSDGEGVALPGDAVYFVPGRIVTVTGATDPAVRSVWPTELW